MAAKHAATLVMMFCLVHLAAHALAAGCYAECVRECFNWWPPDIHAQCFPACAYDCNGTDSVESKASFAEISQAPIPELIAKRGGVKQWYCISGCTAAKQCSQAKGEEASACMAACKNTCSSHYDVPMIKKVVAKA